MVTHLAKDCVAYHKRVVLEAERWTNQEGYSRDRDDDQSPNATARSSIFIFGGPQAYQDRRLQKLTHKWIYATTLAAHYIYAGLNDRLLMIIPIIPIE